MRPAGAFLSIQLSNFRNIIERRKGDKGGDERKGLSENREHDIIPSLTVKTRRLL